MNQLINNLTNETLLDDMLIDMYIFRLRCVGRKHMTGEQLWDKWLNS